jgi:hypothetical protein
MDRCLTMRRPQSSYQQHLIKYQKQVVAASRMLMIFIYRAVCTLCPTAGHGKCSRRIQDVANVYIEARPKGRPEGAIIIDWVVENHADHQLASFRTKDDAIEWAKSQGHAPFVARVRHLNDRQNFEHWTECG